MSVAEMVAEQNRQRFIQAERSQGPRKGIYAQMMGWKSPVSKLGYRLNELLKQFISGFHSSPPQERHNLMKKEIKKFQDFELKDIHYMQLISHWILPKVYYLQEKLREVKGISLSKYNKQKHLLIEKIKNGLRNYRHLKLFYEVAVFAKQEYPQRKITPNKDEEEGKGKEPPQERIKSKERTLDDYQLKRLKKNKQISSSSSDSSQTQIIQERQRSRYKKVPSLKRNKGSRVVRKMK